MPPCVRIGFPVLHPPVDVSDDSYSELHSICGIHSSYRRHRYFSALDDTSWQATWDLNSPRTVEYFYIARADCLSLVSSILIEESVDGLVWTSVDTISTPLPLTGPDDRDLYFELTSPISTQYLRVTILYSSTVQTCFSKIYFGSLSDLGVNPSTSSNETKQSESSRPFRTTSAKYIGARTGKNLYKYSFTFEGVSDSLAKSFFNKVLYDYNLYVVLVGEDEYLNNHEVIHGYIAAPKITRTARGLNKVEFDFVEMFG